MTEAAGGLLGGLVFDPDDEPAPTSGRRRLARALAWLLTLALLAAAGLAGARWWSDRDIRDVLRSSRDAYGSAVQQVMLVRDAGSLASVAGRIQPAADVLDGLAGRVPQGADRRRAAVAAQVRAEAAVVRALAPLTGLTSAPVAVYGRVASGLGAAAEQERRTRAEVAAVDPGAVRGLADPMVLVRHVATAAGGALIEDVQRSGGELLDGLAQAQRTADLRAAGDRAAGQRDAVVAARSGLSTSSAGAKVLDDLVAALDAVAELRQVSPAATGGWPDIRGRLAQHLGAVGEAAGSLAAGSLRARLPIVLATVDGVVDRAAQAQAAWVAARDAAAAQQAADTAALDRYAARVTAALRDAGAARTAIEPIVAQPGTTDATARQLQPLAAALSGAVDTARTEPVPPGVQPAHAALLAGLDAFGAPLAAAVLDLATATCRDCPATTVPGWQPLTAAASVSWDGPARAWRRAVDAARQAVAARQPPAAPDA